MKAVGLTAVEFRRFRSNDVEFAGKHLTCNAWHPAAIATLARLRESVLTNAARRHNTLIVRHLVALLALLIFPAPLIFGASYAYPKLKVQIVEMHGLAMFPFTIFLDRCISNAIHHFEEHIKWQIPR